MHKTKHNYIIGMCVNLLTTNLTKVVCTYKKKDNPRSQKGAGIFYQTKQTSLLITYGTVYIT